MHRPNTITPSQIPITSFALFSCHKPILAKFIAIAETPAMIPADKLSQERLIHRKIRIASPMMINIKKYLMMEFRGIKTKIPATAPIITEKGALPSILHTAK
jgi:hypothetical protein